MGNFLEALKDGKRAIAGLVTKIRSLAAFFATFLGQIILFILGFVLLLIFIYILATTIMVSVAKILGIAGASDFKQDSAMLQSLADSGYQEMLDSNDLINYYAFEYTVLMDAARFLEDTGTTLLKKEDKTRINCSLIDRYEWAFLAALGFQGDSLQEGIGAGFDSTDTDDTTGHVNVSRLKTTEEKERIESQERGTNKYDIFTTEPFTYDPDAPSCNGIFYEKAHNEYTDEFSLVPYIRSRRIDENLRYYLEIKSNGASKVGTTVDAQAAAGVSDSNPEKLDNVDAAITAAGHEFSTSYIYDNNDQTGLGLLGELFRFEADGSEGTYAGGGIAQLGAQFIYNHVFAVKLNKDLNQSNKAAYKTSDASYHANADALNMYAEYPKNPFYSNNKRTTQYRIPLRVILDRFLPNAELLSSWRLLNDQYVEERTGVKLSDTVVSDIQKIYSEACLDGENVEAEKYLLKSVARISATNFDKNTTAQDILENYAYVGVGTVDEYFDGGETTVTYSAYEAKFDSRVKKAEKAENEYDVGSTQEFGGSEQDDIADDIRLAISHYKVDHEELLNNINLSSAFNEIKGKITGDKTTEDIVVYAKDNNGNLLVKCDAVGRNQMSLDANNEDEVKRHYGANNSSTLEIKDYDPSIGTANVYIDGSIATHNNLDEYPECRYPLLRVAYTKDDETGYRTTSVIFGAGNVNYGYLIKEKEVVNYSKVTNNETFAKLEANQVKSTTFKHWEIASGGEESYEHWLVEDLFEGLNIEFEDLSITIYRQSCSATEDGGTVCVCVPYTTITGADIFSLVETGKDGLYDLGLDMPIGTASGTGEGQGSGDCMFRPGNYAVIRPVDDKFDTESGKEEGDTSGVTEIPSRPPEGEDVVPDGSILLDYAGSTKFIDAGKEESLQPPKNAAPDEDTNAPGVSEGSKPGTAYENTCTTTDENGETEIAKKEYLNLKKYGKSDGEAITLNISAIEEYLTPLIKAEYGACNVTYNWSGVDHDFSAIFPTRRVISPISQQIWDKKMNFYLVKDSTLWSATKHFGNTVEIWGEFHKDAPNVEHYLITNNPYAIGFKELHVLPYNDNGDTIWRGEMYAPIFGGENDSDQARENDVRLILSEWEDASKNGVNAADHFIRDLYALIEYSKGFEYTDNDGEQFIMEGVIDPYSTRKYNTYVNPKAYTYLYIPDEILQFDPLTSEKAFWLDRLLCTINDGMDKINEKEENYMRSKLPLFTWQIVDYDKYPETQGTVYALWPFGSQMSRTFYAIASVVDDGSVSQWGGYSEAHKAADLYGRHEAIKIFESVYGGKDGSIEDSTITTEYVGTAKLTKNEAMQSGDISLGSTEDATDNEYVYSSSNSMEEAEHDVIVNSGSEDGEGLYHNNVGVNFRIKNDSFSFNGTAAGTFGYELYRQTMVLKDGDKAQEYLYNKLKKEMLWSEIKAVAPGIVTKVGGDSTSGFYVVLTHEFDDDGETKYVTTSYCHMKRWPQVQVGEYVGAGTLLGYEGTTGKSGGYHCHISLKVASEPQKPTEYFYPFFTPFYYAEKAQEDEFDMSSKYMSTERLVVPYGLSGRGPLKNDYPDIPLVDDMSELGDKTNNVFYKDYSHLRTDHVETFGNKSFYDGELLRSNPDYFDEKFIAMVQRKGGKITRSVPIYAGDIGDIASLQDIWNALLEVIGNEYGVAGMMGNIMAESSFIPGNLNNGANRKYNISDEEFVAQTNANHRYPDGVGGAFGLCQWLGTRRTDLLTFAEQYFASNGGEFNIADPSMQVSYLVHELTTTHKGVFSALQGASDIREASDYVLIHFEAPSSKFEDSMQSYRASLAQRIYNECSSNSEN